MHLGASYLPDPIDYERRVVRFLRSITPHCRRLFILGYALDYWYEYRTVVPRGFTRFFGCLAEMADAGIEITWLIGNHDIWIFDYLPREIGMKVVDGSEIVMLHGKRFFLAHGDGLGKRSRGFRFIRSVFRNKVCQWLFASIHPRWTVPLAHRWSSSSRGGTPYVSPNLGADEPFVKWAIEYQSAHPQEPIDYFVFGHRHILLDEPIGDDTRVIVLGDWINYFSYGVWDGKDFRLEKFNN
ncbi:MAG: UDP-2,3-diacylglucosamine diphosphatase [Muribaculaceae bacterium]|nr:UDP-2,3-diacylglucosamine diphosphatase [Muribaculaceae bacterium]